MPLTPDEIKRGRELYDESERSGRIAKWLAWRSDHINDLLTMAENHAKDVHHAYVEGFQHSHTRRYQFLCNGWKFSEAKKKLEEK